MACAQTCNTTLVLKVKGIVNIAEETFHDMPKLKELTLEENSLARLPADIFKKNTELETLYLRNNQLRAIPADIFRYNTKLVKLYLEHNAITKIEAETFQNNTKLEHLILSNNRLTRIDSDTFKTNLELRELHLAGNAITSLEADTFKYNIKLEALAMGPNPLGCVVRPASVIHFGTEPLPECPDNCTVNTYYDADANVCLACPDSTFTDGVGAVKCVHTSSVIDRQYVRSPNKMASRGNASAYCAAYGGVARIDSEAENARAKDACGVDNLCWLGLLETNRVSGVWEWYTEGIPDPSKCREHDPSKLDPDCCGAPINTWCADGYVKVPVVKCARIRRRHVGRQQQRARRQVARCRRRRLCLCAVQQGTRCCDGSRRRGPLCLRCRRKSNVVGRLERCRVC